jgi:hypothetical protein
MNKTGEKENPRQEIQASVVVIVLKLLGLF